MNIVFMGAKQGGMIGLLSLFMFSALKLKDKYNISLVAHDNIINNIWMGMGYKASTTINDVYSYNGNLDVLISVHGREIVSNEILSKFKYGGINLHPMLSKYKGANPISHFMMDSLHGKTDNMASVGVHRMTDVLDGGEVLSEKFIEIDSPWEKSPAEIYNELYPLYPLVLMEAIQKVCV